MFLLKHAFNTETGAPWDVQKLCKKTGIERKVLLQCIKAFKALNFQLNTMG